MNTRPIEEFANTILHCGDYGELWVNKTSGSVWWVCGDADGDDDEVEAGVCTSIQAIKEGFKNIEGVLEVIVEPEYSPIDYEGYINLGNYGIDNWELAKHLYESNH